MSIERLPQEKDIPNDISTDKTTGTTQPESTGSPNRDAINFFLNLFIGAIKAIWNKASFSPRSSEKKETVDAITKHIFTKEDTLTESQLLLPIALDTYSSDDLNTIKTFLDNSPQLTSEIKNANIKEVHSLLQILLKSQTFLPRIDKLTGNRLSKDEKQAFINMLPKFTSTALFQLDAELTVATNVQNNRPKLYASDSPETLSLNFSIYVGIARNVDDSEGHLLKNIENEIANTSIPQNSQILINADEAQTNISSRRHLQDAQPFTGIQNSLTQEFHPRDDGLLEINITNPKTMATSTFITTSQATDSENRLLAAIADFNLERDQGQKHSSLSSELFQPYAKAPRDPQKAYTAAGAGFVFRKEGKLSLLPKTTDFTVRKNVTIETIGPYRQALLAKEPKSIREGNLTLHVESFVKKVGETQYLEMRTTVEGIDSKKTQATRTTHYVIPQGQTKEQVIDSITKSSLLERDLLLAKSRFFSSASFEAIEGEKKGFSREQLAKVGKNLYENTKTPTTYGDYQIKAERDRNQADLVYTLVISKGKKEVRKTFRHKIDQWKKNAPSPKEVLVDEFKDGTLRKNIESAIASFEQRYGT